MSDETPVENSNDIRERAIAQLKKRRDFKAHVLVYVLMNSFLVTIWAFTSHGFFWPVFIMFGWGIGLLMNAWDVYFGQDFDEAHIQREMQHLQHR
jgi:hypothetical protein